MTLDKQKFLEFANDPNCVGIGGHMIPWGKLVKEDFKKLSDLLCSPGHSKMDIATHESIQGILEKYSDRSLN